MKIRFQLERSRHRWKNDSGFSLNLHGEPRNREQRRAVTNRAMGFHVPQRVESFMATGEREGYIQYSD
jgi:hypothetical protein